MTHTTSLQLGPLSDLTNLAEVKGWKTGTVNVDPVNISAGASLETAVNITGVAVGDIVIFEPPASLESGLSAECIGRVSAANTVQIRLTNATAGAINGAQRTWRYFWIDLT